MYHPQRIASRVWRILKLEDYDCGLALLKIRITDRHSAKLNVKLMFKISFVKTPRHIIKIEVKEEHIDDLGHVNNEVYLKWVLMIAGEHWIATAPVSIQRSFKWVVRRHELDYLKPAFKGDQLTVTTWVDVISGVQSVRRVQIKRGDDIILEACTTWIMIDANSGKLHRIPKELAKLFLP